MTSISKVGYHRLESAGFSVSLYLPSAKLLKINQKKLFFRIWGTKKSFLIAA